MPNDTVRQPGVSVLVPTHNRPVQVKRAVESALGQEYGGPIEVVVVFDGEEPYDLGVSVPDNRELHPIANTGTRGLAGARNAGIAAAEHPLVAFLDDDDWWAPHKLALQVPLLLSLPGAPLVCAGITMVTPQGEVARPLDRQPVAFDDLLADRVTELHSSSVLARLDLLRDQVGPVDEKLPGSYGEDYDLLLRAAKIHPIHGIVDPQVYVTFAGGSLFAAKWQMIISALKLLLDKYPEFAGNRRGYARIAGQIAFGYAALGDRSSARTWARAALRRNPIERRAALALLVALRVVSADRVLAELQNRGRGL